MAQVSTPTIYIENPAARSHQYSGKIHGCGSAEFRGNPNIRKLLLQRFFRWLRCGGNHEKDCRRICFGFRCITRATGVCSCSGEFPFVFEPRKEYTPAALSIPPQFLHSARKPSSALRAPPPREEACRKAGVSGGC